MNVDDHVSQSMGDSLPPTVELKVYKLWCLWSGYPLIKTYGPWGRRLAKTDGPDFYEEAAFPSLKPDIDIFGVPQRSRTQRGWYQRVTISPPAPLNPLREIRRPPAIPSDIPPELFENILRHVQGKHALARCGLVCRYWSKRCQRTLFTTVALRSREDALVLLSFMRNPTSNVSRYVSKVDIPPFQVSGIPWIHLLPLITDQSKYQYLTPMESFEVLLEGPLLPGQRSLRSIHHALPRSTPHLSRHIHLLDLRDLHFAQLDDLMHLAWEMPHLRILRCAAVTWGSFPNPIPPSRRKPSRPFCPWRVYCQKVSLEKACGPHPVEAAMWLYTSLSVHSTDQVLSSDDLTRVFTIAQLLDKATNGALAPSVIYSADFRINIRNENRIQFIEDRAEYVQDRLNKVHHPLLSIHTIVMRFRKPQASNSTTEPAFVWRNLDWDIMGRTVSSFPTLMRVIIGMDSREDIVAFDSIAMVHMSRLHSAGMLKYALWDPNGATTRSGSTKGIWLRASLDSDDTEHTLSSCLLQRLLISAFDTASAYEDYELDQVYNGC